MSAKTMIALSIAVTLGDNSSALARMSSPTEPYGTPAQQQRCVANMEASLHGRSPLGRRGTAAYIQDRGNLYDMGLSEYDVLVGRCMNRLYHQYLRAHGRRR